MNLYLLLPLVQGVFSLALLTIVLIKGNRRSTAHHLFSLFLLGLALWGFLIYGMRASPDLAHAFIWDKLVVIIGSFLPVVFYHFSIRYTHIKIHKHLLPILYAIGILFIPLVAMNLAITGMQVKPFGYAPVLGPVHALWLLFVYCVWIMAFINLLHTWRSAIYEEFKNRVAYILIGMCLEFLGGFFEILTALGLPLYPGVIIGHIGFCTLTSIAILKHHLLDIHVVIRRGIAYIVTSTLISLPFVGVLLLFVYLPGETEFPVWGYYTLLILLAFALPQIWEVVQHQVDKWFYRERYDHLKILETFSHYTQDIYDSATFCSALVDLLKEALHTKSVYLLCRASQDEDFTAVACRKNDYIHFCPTIENTIKKSSLLIRWLENNGGILTFKQLEFIPQLQGTIQKEKEMLQRVKAELIAPLKSRTGSMTGILILGQKLSEQSYSVADKQLITALGTQTATRLENIRLFEDSVRTRSHLESWLNSMTDVVIIVNSKYEILFMNNEAKNSFGNIDGIKCWQALGNMSMCEDCPMEQFLHERCKSYRRELVNKGKHYEVMAAPMPNNDGTLLIIEVLRDTTERIRARETEKMIYEELNKSRRLAGIGELAAGVAHEINNPLTGILGLSQRLLRRSESENKQYLEMIYQEALRASKVVENLRNFARPRESKKELLSINDILKKTLEFKNYELKTGNIKVEMNLTQTLPPVLGDYYQILQVFLNIIANAEQAISEANKRGEISIQTQEIDHYIRITFSDNGPGIPENNLDKLFTPFFSSKTEKGGTGLGLSICKSIVTEHKGRIAAKNNKDAGATFIVDLPIHMEKSG